MNNILNQVKAELKQLPLMLGKLFGGIAAVIGFTAAVVIVTRKPDPAMAVLLPYLLVGCAGGIIFALAARALNRRLPANSEVVSKLDDRTRMNMLAWGLLLLFVGIFLAGTYFLTG